MRNDSLNLTGGSEERGGAVVKEGRDKATERAEEPIKSAGEA